jgi:hypothetical protein
MRCLSALCLLLGSAAPAAAVECRIALALAMDVSRSVDGRDYRVQAEGLADALTDPAVRRAFLSGDAPVAFAVYEWSGVADQAMVEDWVIVQDEAGLDALAARMRALTRPAERHLTALGAALDYGLDLMRRAPDCRRLVLDVSGDGQNNEGPPPARSYARADWSGITVNGLAIGEHESLLPEYFSRELLRGPGAFVEVAPRQSDFPAAIRRKLIRELTDQVAEDVRPGRLPG